MKRYGVRQSICPSVRLRVRFFVRPSVPAWAQNSKPAAAGLLLWARRPGDIDRLLQQQRAAGECGQCHVVSVRISVHTGSPRTELNLTAVQTCFRLFHSFRRMYDCINAYKFVESSFWLQIFNRCGPVCVCKVMVRGHRSDYDLSGLNVDDIVVMPCVNFGKNTHFFQIAREFILCKMRPIVTGAALSVYVYVCWSRSCSLQKSCIRRCPDSPTGKGQF